MHYRKPNGGSNTELDVEHELPSAEDESATAPGTTPEDGGKVANVATTELEAELEKLRQQNAAYLDRAARIQAEFDNYRKRNAREQQDYREYALADALRQLLPILDSLDRALQTNAASVEDFRSGIELIDKQFHDALAKLGVQPVAAEGESFDPNLHQAVQMVESEEAPDNTVIGELQRGYKLKDRLLRPAMVRVARNSKP